MSQLRKAIRADNLDDVRRIILEQPELLLPQPGGFDPVDYVHGRKDSNPVAAFLRSQWKSLDEFQKAMENERWDEIRQLVKTHPEFARTASIDSLMPRNGPYDDTPPEHWELMEAFLQQGAGFSSSTLPDLVFCDAPRRLIELLLEKGADINAPDEAGKTAIFRVRDPENAEFLVSRGARLDVRDTQGSTPLFNCGDNKAMADYWLAHGGNLNDTNAHGTVLKCAMEGFGTIDPVLGMEWIEKGALYDPADPSKNVLPIKAFALSRLVDGQSVPRLQVAAGIFDRLVGELADQEGKLPRRIPQAKFPSEEFVAFAEVVGKVHKLVQALDPNHPEKYVSTMFVNLLDHTQGSWREIRDQLKEYGEADFVGFRDAVRALTENILLPEVIQRTTARSRLVDYDKAVDEMMPLVAEKIISNRGPQTVLALSRAWHHDLPQLEALRDVPREGKWEPLAPDYTAPNGDTVTFITNAADLQREGATLQHCVGGYTQQCVSQPIHIASIRRNGVPVSTVELEESPESEEKVRVVQHRGRNDVIPAPSSPESRALRSFLNQVKEKPDGTAPAIRIDFEHLAAARETRQRRISDFKARVGFDPLADDAPEKQEKMFRGYLAVHSNLGKTHAFIPGGEKKGKEGVQAFLENPLNPPDDNRTLIGEIVRISRNPPRLKPQDLWLE